MKGFKMNQTMLMTEISKSVDEKMNNSEVFTLYDVTKKMKDNISQSLSSDPQERIEQEEILRESHYNIKDIVNAIVQMALVPSTYTFTSCHLTEVDGCPRANVFHPDNVNPNTHYQINGVNVTPPSQPVNPQPIVTPGSVMVQATNEGRINFPKSLISQLSDKDGVWVIGNGNSVFISANSDGRLRITPTILGFDKYDEYFMVNVANNEFVIRKVG